VAARTALAPPVLRERVRRFAAEPSTEPSIARHLASAAARALGTVVGSPGDRSVALDLLAADALITLALLAQAEAAPEGLAEFATALLGDGLPA
jgi:hypothetical protein